jgi:hypothetical protein
VEPLGVPPDPAATHGEVTATPTLLHSHIIAVMEG